MLCPKCQLEMTFVEEHERLIYRCANQFSCGYVLCLMPCCDMCIHNDAFDNEFIDNCRHCKYNPDNDMNNFRSI